jgi:ribosome-binding protein aMBF1 (putative translation factor)
MSRNDKALRRKLAALRERVGAEPNDAAFYTQIAEQVVEQRRLRGLSQQELAELVGTSQPGIARFERGSTPARIDTLLRMADALDCELVVKFRPRTKPKGGRR